MNEDKNHRNYCYHTLYKFCETDFADIFSASGIEKSNLSSFLLEVRNNYEKIIHRELTFDFSPRNHLELDIANYFNGLKLFENELISIIEDHKDGIRKKNYFERLKEDKDQYLAFLPVGREQILIIWDVNKPKSFDSSRFDSYLELLNLIFKPYIEIVTKYLELYHQQKASPLQQTKAKDFKEMDWFKVGLLFATGEMDRLIKQYLINRMPNCTKIARHLGNKNYRPYISESINKRNHTDKNIFSDNKKLLKIHAHCLKENIPMVEDFLKHIKPE